MNERKGASKKEKERNIHHKSENVQLIEFEKYTIQSKWQLLQLAFFANIFFRFLYRFDDVVVVVVVKFCYF